MLNFLSFMLRNFFLVLFWFYGNLGLVGFNIYIYFFKIYMVCLVIYKVIYRSCLLYLYGDMYVKIGGGYEVFFRIIEELEGLFFFGLYIFR